MNRLHVHLSPLLVAPEQLAGTVVVVIDVLRATSTIVQALHAGCRGIYPCATIEEARQRAAELAPLSVVLAGERDGVPIAGFDAGNSPQHFTAERCRDRAVVFTTSNGTRALLHARAAERVLTAAFVNRAAVCDHLRAESRPVHVVCAGDAGGVALEDVLLAGAMAARLPSADWDFDDSAQLALAAWLRLGGQLLEVLRNCRGGLRLRQLGYDEDIGWAARLDVFDRVPESRGHPPRLE